MFRIKDSIHIQAPLERCFLISTSIDLVQQTLQMRPVPMPHGKTSGLVHMGDRVLWRGWKFGLPAVHETLITGYDRPFYFQDTMARGRFRRFFHDHHFQEVDGQAVLWDVVNFSLPLGPLGRLVGRWIVAPYVLRLMSSRFQLIKRLAEGEGWRRYVDAAASLPQPETPHPVAAS